MTPTRISPSDLDLLRGLRRGEADACAAFVQRHLGRMLATARRFLRDEAGAREAVREGFRSFVTTLGDPHDDTPVPIRLQRATLEAALGRLRGEEPRGNDGLDALLPSFDASGHHARPVPEWRADAIESLACGDDREAVRRAVERLPATYRKVLLLRDVEERSTEETARLLGTTAAAVRVRLHRARQALRALLEPSMRLGAPQGQALAAPPTPASREATWLGDPSS